MNKGCSIHFRINPSNPEHVKAYQNLLCLTRETGVNFNSIIVTAVNEYSERYRMRNGIISDQNKEKIEAYVRQIVDGVNTSIEKTLPVFLAGLLAGKVHESDIQEPESSPVPVAVTENNGIGEDDIDWGFVGDE